MMQSGPRGRLPIRSPPHICGGERARPGSVEAGERDLRVTCVRPSPASYLRPSVPSPASREEGAPAWHMRSQSNGSIEQSFALSIGRRRPAARYPTWMPAASEAGTRRPRRTSSPGGRAFLRAIR
jgi:hypothetical protein